MVAGEDDTVQIVSGYRLGTVVFVASVQAALALFCAFAGIYFFATAFLMIALVIVIWGLVSKGKHFCFEKYWLQLHSDWLELVENTRIQISKDLKVSHGRSYVNSAEEPVVGWKLWFQDQAHDIQYHFTNRKNYTIALNAVAKWARKNQVSFVSLQESEET